MIDINDVYKVYDKHLYLETYHLPIIAIATYITKDLPGKPLWVVPVAPSSYGKTTITSFVPYLEKTDQNKYQVYCMDQLTSKAFASGLKVKGNKSYGELLQNQNSMIYFSDMASLLVSEDSKKIFAMFRTLYDGEIKLDTGKEKPHYENIHTNILGFSTPDIQRDIGFISRMGTRELVYRLPEIMNPEFMADKIPELGLKEINETVTSFIEEVSKNKPKTIDDDTKKYLEEATKTIALLRVEPTVSDGGIIQEQVHMEYPKRLYDQLVKLWNGMDMMGVDEKTKREIIADIVWGSGSEVRAQVLNEFFGWTGNDDDLKTKFFNFDEPMLCGGKKEFGRYDINRYTTIREFSNFHYLDQKVVTKEFLTLASLGYIHAIPEFPEPQHAHDPWFEGESGNIEIYPEDRWHYYDENTKWDAPKRINLQDSTNSNSSTKE